MKITPRYLILIISLFVVIVSSILFFRPGIIASLFSQSISDVGLDSGIPTIQSLDNQIPEDTSPNHEQQMRDLEKELLNTERDPEKELEIRRRLQILRDEIQANAQ